MSDSSGITFLVDPSATPTTAAAAVATGRANTALYSLQGGVVGLGSDYAATPKAQIPKVDANGSAYVVAATPAGTSQTVAGGSAPGSLSAQYGTPLMMRQDLPTPSAWIPATADPTAALFVHPKSKQTFHVLATSVTAAANKSMISVYNGSSNMVLRLNALYFYVPPAGVSGALLGQGTTTYYPLIAEVRRATSITGGTSITPAQADTGDTLASGIVAAYGATVGGTQTTFMRADAVANTANGLPFYGRSDANGKVLVLRPGEGFTATCISNGTVGASGGGTTTASCDLVAVITQAGA